MIVYEANIRKFVRKGLLPKEVFKRFHNIFIALEATEDLGLFDIKRLKSTERRAYYRLRKGKYRAIFFLESGDYHVMSIAKRGEVYRKWESFR